MDIRIVVEKKDARGDWKAEYFDVVDSDVPAVLAGIKSVVKDLKNPFISKVNELAQKAIEIYDRVYRERLEATAMDKFAAINTTNEQAFVGDDADQAITLAQEINPDGTFHLIRIGHQAAFTV